jgi:hypothetical protein
MSDSESQSSVNRGGPDLPKGVLKTKGWRLDLEMCTKSRPTVSSAPTAVDLRQFQNFEVGKGYQAQHVVRQPQAAAGRVDFIDMSRQHQPLEKEAPHKSRHSANYKESKDWKTRRLQRYLQSSVFRRFRRELEKIK